MYGWRVGVSMNAGMSVMGQERTLAAMDFMSALPPITDINSSDVCFRGQTGRNLNARSGPLLANNSRSAKANIVLAFGPS